MWWDFFLLKIFYFLHHFQTASIATHGYYKNVLKPHSACRQINLHDDSLTLDGDSSTLIRNEAIEPDDEWRQKEICELVINEIIY